MLVFLPKASIYVLNWIYCCDSTNDDCMLGSCENCSIPKKFSKIDDDASTDTDSSDGEIDGDQVSYCKWARVEKKVQKITVTEERSDCVESWKESVKSLKQHIFRKRSQAASLIESKSNLKEGQLLMQVDYSESYKNAEQNEIQSAYFGHTCFSIFTACCYYKAEEGELIQESHHSLAFVNSLKLWKKRLNQLKRSLFGVMEWGHSFVQGSYLCCFQPSTLQSISSGITMRLTMAKGLWMELVGLSKT